MENGRYRLIEKEDLYFAGKLWRLRFDAPGIEAQPGQFVNIAVEGRYLRRPISVSEYEDGVLSLVVQIVGEGSRRIVGTPVGSSLGMLTGLGNCFRTEGFETPENKGRHKIALLIGGGVGYAPLVGLMKKLRKDTDMVPFAVFGFNGETDVPLRHITELREEGYHVEYSTMTGEMGDRGNALEVALEYMEHYGMQPAVYYTCGPLPMIKAVTEALDFPGQLSLEARMGCGFGACMGCTVMTTEGPKRICKEGPVFDSTILTFNERVR